MYASAPPYEDPEYDPEKQQREIDYYNSLRKSVDATPGPSAPSYAEASLVPDPVQPDNPSSTPQLKDNELSESDYTLINDLLNEELQHPTNLPENSTFRSKLETEFLQKIRDKHEERRAHQSNTTEDTKEVIKNGMYKSARVSGKLMKMIMASIAAYNFQSRRLNDLSFKSRKARSNYPCGSDTCKERALKIRNALIQLLFDYPPEALAELGITDTAVRSLRYLGKEVIGKQGKRLLRSLPLIGNFVEKEMKSPSLESNSTVPVRNTMYARAVGSFNEFVDEKGKPLQDGWRRRFKDGTTQSVYVRTAEPNYGQEYWTPEMFDDNLTSKEQHYTLLQDPNVDAMIDNVSLETYWQHKDGQTSWTRPANINDVMKINKPDHYVGLAPDPHPFIPASYHSQTSWKDYRRPLQDMQKTVTSKAKDIFDSRWFFSKTKAAAPAGGRFGTKKRKGIKKSRKRKKKNYR